MTFHDVQFPTTISYGSSGGPGYKTEIIESDSGAEERVARWEQARHTYDASSGLKKPSDVSALLNFYHARQGSAYGFRWKDWNDYTSNPTDNIGSVASADQYLGTGDGAGTTYQLRKTYTSGGIDRIRNITLPVSGTVLVAVGGLLQTEGVDYTVNYTTGVITFSAPATDGEDVTAGFEFDVPCRFGKELDDVFNVTLENWETGSIGSIPIVEIVNHTPIEDRVYYGGAVHLGSLTGDLTIDPLQARVISANAGSGGHALILPNPATYPTGGPICYIHNTAISFSFTVEYPSGTVLATVAAGDTVTVLLGVDLAGTTNVWVVF